VIIFSEGTVHGASPWRASHTRRLALYRFAPQHVAYGRCYAEGWPAAYLQGMTPAQLAVMQAPFAQRLDRAIPEVDGTTRVLSRTEAKRQHDKQVFGTDYF